MQNFDITHFWMLGVMLIMCLFFGAALYGHIYKKNNSKLPTQRQKMINLKQDW